MARPTVVFMGTPDFAVPSLAALQSEKYTILGVYTQPPRPSGRGQEVHKSPVHLYAEAHGYPVFTPRSLRSEEEIQNFSALNPDFVVVAAYGLLLPGEILTHPPKGCLNVHASLLPRWRGAAPIQYAILAGDTETGISLMRMVRELDAGDVYVQEKIPLTPTTTGQSLHDDLAALGATLLKNSLPALLSGDLEPEPQDRSFVTYAHKLSKEAGELRWTCSATELERKVRAFTPWPGGWFRHKGKRIKVLEAKEETCPQETDPGTVLDTQLTISCGKGALRLIMLQPEGKKPMNAQDFLNGHALPIGTVLEA